MISWIAQIAGELRYACRTVARMPGLALVVIVSLGVGIGVNTAVFTRLQFMVFEPLPGVAAAGRLQLVEPRTDAGGYPGVSWLEYRDLSERLSSFQGLLAARGVPLTLNGTDRVDRAMGQIVSGNFFSALGVRPVLGRVLQVDDAAQIGREPVAVISHDLWQTRFAGAADVVGRQLRVNRQDLTIVGVAPAEFQGTIMGLQYDLWIPATLAQQLLAGSRELEDRDWRGYAVLGELTPGVTFEQTQGELDRAMSELARIHPETNATMRAEVVPFWQSPRGPQRMLVSVAGVLQAIMLVVLISICGNTATLMLTRASERRREMGVRLAIGASRWRIAGTVLAENVLLALLAAGLGMVIAVWATEALRTIDMPGNMPFRFQTRVDAVGFAFAALLGIICGVIFGAAPALQLARVEPQQAIRAGAPLAGSNRMRSALMASQVALALIVLVVAAILMRGFIGTKSIETGFKKEGLLLATYDLTGRDADPRTFVARVQPQLRQIPGVDAAAVSMSVPLDIHGLPARSFTLEGRAREDGRLDRAASNTVTPGYFETMGIPLREGKDFVDLLDTVAPAETVVNEAFVQRYLDGAPAIGRRVQSGNRTFVIAGVVATSASDALGEPPTPAIYFSYRDRPSAVAEMHVRARGGAEAALADDVRGVMQAIDATLPVYNVRTMREHIDKNLVLRRIPAQLFLVLGPMLLALAAIGIYGVVGHVVASRAPEIGVRLALGATARRVVAEVVGQSLRAVGTGALAGWILACVITFDFLSGGIDAIPVLVAVPLLLLLVAALAAWVPARRAATVDPMTALRQD